MSTPKSIYFSLVIILMNHLILSHSQSKMIPKIVGGEYIKIKNVPHAVFLNAKCNSLRWICGASVLNQRIVVTAAHCLDNCNVKRNIGHTIRVIAGTEDYQSKGAVVRNLVDLCIHEFYDEVTVANDIALGELSSALPLNDAIKRIVLRVYAPNQNNGVVAGWGIINEESHATISNLKYVPQQIISRKTCSNFVTELGAGMLCATNPKSSEYPAAGDSGSGFIGDQGQIIGLVSFRDWKSNTVLVYTNVTYYYRWIIGHAKPLVCTK